jgi:hypothetical protein
MRTWTTDTLRSYDPVVRASAIKPNQRVVTEIRGGGGLDGPYCTAVLRDFSEGTAYTIATESFGPNYVNPSLALSEEFAVATNRNYILKMNLFNLSSWIRVTVLTPLLSIMGRHLLD